MVAGNHSTGSTAFERAFQELLDTVKSHPKKHLSKFLLKCQNVSKNVSLETAAELIEQAENASAERKSRRVTRKILEPVVDSLKAYDKVISTLCSADPMPTAIIWGALKVVVDCTDRFTNLFSLIRTQLSALRDRIEDIQEYESLFGRSPELQLSLFDFYKNLIRFWSRVDKECSRPALLSVVQAAIPLTMTKIRNIITDIEANVDKIHEKVQIIDLRESKEERVLNLQTRQALQDAEMHALHSRLRDWLEPSAYQFSSDTHQHHVDKITPGTLEWLSLDPDIQTWASADSKSPILWATAAPGFGKTIACSRVIENVKQDHPEAAVCYHFYQKTEEVHPARQVLRSFASQLLEKMPLTKLNVPDFRRALQEHKDIIKNIVTLIELLLLETKTAFFFIDGLDEATSGRDTRVVVDTRVVLTALSLFCDKFTGKVHFWCSSQSTAPIRELMGTAKMISFDGRNINDVRDYLHEALHRALRHKYQSEDVDEEDQVEDICDVASRLGEKAHGSFYWASLMKHDIEHAEAPAEVSAIMNSDVPDGLDAYFTHILHRIERPKWPLASLLLSLICYARRPLRVSELREAVAILRSKDQTCIDRTQRPFPRDMEKILLPLIQLDESDQNRRVYKVCHSTVTEFLHKYPNILCADSRDSSGSEISGQLLGEACLRYLRQDRFSQCLFKRDDLWYVQDGSKTGSAVTKDPFTTYAAKYWSAHLSMIDHDKRPSIYKQISQFVGSPNFWTCLQIQSIFVVGQFGTFTVLGHNNYEFKKRFLPHWYIHEPGNPVFGELRTFLHEWSYFLEDPNSKKLCHGEIDRCLISGLGPKSFLAGAKQRYNNFTLPLEHDSNAGDRQFETCSTDGKLLSLLNMRYDYRNDQFEFRASRFDTQNRWPMKSTTPVVWNAKTDAVDWLPYTCFKHIHDKSCLCIGKPRLADISSCGRIIRVADKIWRWNEDDKLVPLRFRNASPARLALEHVECKDNLIFITSRQKVVVKRKIDHIIRMSAKQKSMNIVEEDRNLVTKFYETHTAPELRILGDVSVDAVDTDRNNFVTSIKDKIIPGAENAAENVDSSDSDSVTESEYESSVVHEFETEQYWSEASTTPEEHGVVVDEVPLHVAASDAGKERKAMTKANSNQIATKDDEDSSEGTFTNDEMSTPSHGSDSDTYNGSPGKYQYSEDSLENGTICHRDSDSSENFGIARSDEEDAQYAVGPSTKSRTPQVPGDRPQFDSSDDDDIDDELDDVETKKKIMMKESVATLRVYRDDGGILKPVFKLNWSSARPVCNSPPAIHPHKPLVVWPLTDSLLLFVDYAENTWFKKKLRPPRGHRFVTIRCHFSGCGNYLHIAALKRQVVQPTSGKKEGKKQKRNKKHKQGQQTDKSANKDRKEEQTTFSLLVLTYVLSKRKTSYSPPRLIFRQAISLPMMEHPFLTFVWTKDELFTAHSGNILCAFRINLFHYTGQNPPVGTLLQQESIDVEPDSIALPKLAETATQNRKFPYVMVPNQTIYLPWSARKRPVYIIPATDTGPAECRLRNQHIIPASPSNNLPYAYGTEPKQMATVFIGPEKSPIAIHRTPNLMEQLQNFGVSRNGGIENEGLGDTDAHLPEDEKREGRIVGVNDCAPLTGVLLDEEDDLGGWGVFDSTEKITEGQGLGTLDDMIELFDPEDDCDDVEPWIIN